MEQQRWKIVHPTESQAQEVMDLVALCDIEAIGEPDIVLSDVVDLWQAVDIDQDVWIAVTDTGGIVGYGFVEVTGKLRLDSCVFVHPEWKRQGIGTMLIERIESRAKELVADKDGTHMLMNQLPYTNESARTLVESKGYTFSRLYERMKVELTGPPEVPEIRDTLTLRSFRPGQDEHALFHVYDETFRDSWGYAQKDEATWLEQKTADGYDPSLWFMVWHGDEAVGFLMGRMDIDGLFIDLLGVKRAYRKHGVGKALLLHAFGVAYAKGQNTVILYVDSDSLTRAHQLYRSVGMTPHSQTAVYRKPIHA